MSFKIYKFSAEWCGPCKRLAPLLTELLVQTELSSYFEEVDIEENEEMVEKYNVKSLPTVIFLKDGVVVQKIESLDMEKIQYAVYELKKMKEATTRHLVDFVPTDVSAMINLDF